MNAPARLLGTTVVVVSLVLGACGGTSADPSESAATDNPTPVQAATAGGASSPGDGAHEPSRRGTPTTVDTARSTDAQPRAATNEGAGEASETEEPATPSAPEGVITSVEPNCLARPGAVQAIIESAPFADVAYGAAFADGQSHGQYGIGQADAAGRFVWNIAVPADAAPGLLRLTVGAASVEHDEGGEGSAEVLVTEGGECP